MSEYHLLAIFAHPDDEVFRCGGTLALLATHGVHVHILTFTRGQAGSCGQPPICMREDLGIVRTEELRCSCQTLGLEDPQMLDYEDGKLAEVTGADGVAHIIAAIRSIHPQVLLTWPPDGLSGHPDHVAVSQWTSIAYREVLGAGLTGLAAIYHLAMPASLATELGMKQLHTIPDEEISAMIDVHSVWEKKIAAIACHRTQASESPILQAPAERQRSFLGREHFYRAMADQPEDVIWNLYQEQKENGIV